MNEKILDRLIKATERELIIVEKRREEILEKLQNLKKENSTMEK